MDNLHTQYYLFKIFSKSSLIHSGSTYLILKTSTSKLPI
nr:hypothetical protein CJLB15_00059 [Campylobacter phage CJLB-15]